MTISNFKRLSGFLFLSILIDLTVATRFALARPAYPVIFIHGFNASSETWHSFSDVLSGAGWILGGKPKLNSAGNVEDVSPGDYYTINFSDYNVQPFPSQSLSLVVRGYEIDAIIKAVLQVNPGAGKVILVGHSMGGLAARAYLQGRAAHFSGGTVYPYTGDVASLITVGTPHLGAELALFCQVYHETCQSNGINPQSVSLDEMRPDSTLMLSLDNLSVNPMPLNVSYSSIIGTGEFLINLDGLPGDGVVSSYSQNLGSLAGASVLNHTSKEIWVSESGCRYAFIQRHMCEADDTSVQAEILSRINRIRKPPAVSTAAATNVTTTSATINLSIDTAGTATDVWFDWGLSTTFGNSTSHQTVATFSGPMPLSMTIGGLTCNTTYYFRAHAQNSGGSPIGSTLSFGTASCGGGPQSQELITNGTFESGATGWIPGGSFYIGSQPCPYSGSQYAFLAQQDGTPADSISGTLDQSFVVPANASNVTLSFRYSVKTNDSQPNDAMSVWIYNGSGTTALRFLRAYTNLDAQSGCGASFYRQESFDLSEYAGQTVRLRFLATTDSHLGTPTVFRVDNVSISAVLSQAHPPSVTTGGADQVTPSSARLNMTVNPNNASTTVWFNLEAGDPTPDNETEHIQVGNGTQSSVTISVFNLQCGTLYYFMANAINAVDSVSGSVQSFTTNPCIGGPPWADTDPAANITNTSAVLMADIDPNGLSTQAWFTWSTTPSLGQATTHIAIASATPVSYFLTGLTCGTDYYFQSHASNSAGQSSGAIILFSTVGCAGLPTVIVTAPDSTASEGDLSTGILRISRTGSTASPLSIACSVSGTASNGIDYNSIGCPLVIPAGSNFLDVPIVPWQDSAVESVETVVLTLVPQSQYVVGTPNGATVTIISDDADCAVSAIAPAGGEVWMKGRPHTIQWSATSGCSQFVVNVIRSGDYDVTIASSLSGTQLEWTPPAWLVPGSNLQLEVMGCPASGYCVSAMTNTFSLVNPPILPSILFFDRVEGIDGVGYRSSYGWGTTDYTSHSTSHAYANIPDFYGHDVDSTLTTAKIDVTGRRRLFLSFWQSFEFANLASATVWVRAGQGDWTLMRTSDTTQVGWWPVTIDLGPFLGQSTVEVSFQSHYSGTSGDSGAWYLDDIQVYEPLPTEFYTLQPCRVFDTRTNASPLYPAPSPLRTFGVFGNCGIPNRARAISANVTVVNATSAGYVSLYPADQAKSTSSTVSFQTGQVRANNMLLPLSVGGSFGAIAGIASGSQVDLVLDVNGYFYDYAPLVGEWQGTLAQQYPADIQISRNGNSFNAQMSTGHPADDMNVVSVSDVFFHAFRPADTNAEIFLYLDSSGSSLCLTGEYIENGGSRPLSVCKVQ